jgi:hypothetical protein
MAAAPDLLTFVETTVFTKRVIALRLEESLQMLQQELIANPEAGDLEPGTGACARFGCVIQAAGRVSVAARAFITCGSNIKTASI